MVQSGHCVSSVQWLDEEKMRPSQWFSQGFFVSSVQWLDEEKMRPGQWFSQGFVFLQSNGWMKKRWGQANGSVRVLCFFSALTLIVGWQEEHLACESLHRSTNHQRLSSGKGGGEPAHNPSIELVVVVVISSGSRYVLMLCCCFWQGNNIGMWEFEEIALERVGFSWLIEVAMQRALISTEFLYIPLSVFVAVC